MAGLLENKANLNSSFSLVEVEVWVELGKKRLMSTYVFASKPPATQRVNFKDILIWLLITQSCECSPMINISVIAQTVSLNYSNSVLIYEGMVARLMLSRITQGYYICRYSPIYDADILQYIMQIFFNIWCRYFPIYDVDILQYMMQDYIVHPTSLFQ